MPRTLFTATIIAASLTTGYAQQRKPIHKAVAKPVSQHLTISDLTKLYVLDNLPDVDEYLTNRKWRFNQSKNEEQGNQVIYIHKNANGTYDGDLNILYCTNPDNKECPQKSFHTGSERQHIYMLAYTTNKEVFDKLKGAIREVIRPYASRTGNNTITTIFNLEYYDYGFMVDNSEAETEYRVLLKGKKKYE